ncbi:gastrula zinc finger protein XlCGF57.1-like [Helicoverpa zea]|uniref:gastrula zinc finger protein XlCGF57.1-like n=1 Tax=Helicoverpa zea TaxID=7113 RepID=UPI001F592C05|nr:gastrula zinc finger protein XlCGF57.1-like [Helicoverpa zea]
MVSIKGGLDGNIKIRTCRICLDASADDMVLLSDHNGWLNNFEYCFGITLTIKDEPRLLCKLCADSVENYVQFKKKCEKSHILWQSVISNVQCYIVKHNTLENGNTSVDNAVNNLNGNEPNVITQSLYTEIKLESDEERSYHSGDEIKLENNECFDKRKISTIDIKECLDTKGLDLKLKNSQDENRKKVEIIKCKRCHRKYKGKARYQTHLPSCKLKKRKKKLVVDNDYAYNCGRNFNCDNDSKIKLESNNDDNIKVFSENQTDGQCLCGLCGQSFSTRASLNQHLNEHWSSNSLSCGLCDFIGIDLAAIASHRYSHYPRTDDMRFMCHICSYRTVSLLALHFHYRSKHLNKIGGHCTRCDKDFLILRHWKRHEQTHFTTKCICDFCGKTFYSKYSMMEHLMTHMRLFKIICHICGNHFCRKSYLKVHIKAVHSTGPVKCSHCGNMFKNEIVLKKHLRLIKMEKIFECTFCNKKFVHLCQLKSHMVFHSEERPYCCEICGSRYKSNSQLKVHMRKHTGLFPFKCTQCTKAFASSNQLKRHYSVHTGVRSHRCVVPTCGRTFHARKLMLAHLALRHKDHEGLDLQK